MLRQRLLANQNKKQNKAQVETLNVNTNTKTLAMNYQKRN